MGDKGHVAPTPFGLFGGHGPDAPPPLRPLPARDCFHLAGAGRNIVFLRGHTDTVAARVFRCELGEVQLGGFGPEIMSKRVNVVLLNSQYWFASKKSLIKVNLFYLYLFYTCMV